MLRLVFTVCMVTSPEHCEQRDMLVYERMSIMACMHGAIPEFAIWSQSHPDWRISRWRCEADALVKRTKAVRQIRAN
jgi:hypothetical protein